MQLRRRGLSTTNFFEAGAFLRGRDDVDSPNLQNEFLPLTRRLRNGRLVPVPGVQFWVDLSGPASRGSVRLASADPDDAPLTVFSGRGDRGLGTAARLEDTSRPPTTTRGGPFAMFSCRGA
ncbi:hypothetical protein [Geodermatophilus sp. CPCC 205761]|uniref:hypothetical protein n=1 Tax=Geodermatophilus sp. CPCC 205761 TaxID=2936597 RepID=UPI003EED6623